MSDPQEPTTELGPPTDVSVDPEELRRQEEEQDGASGESPTGSAARYEEGDAKGGTGGLDAGGAG